MSAIKPFLEEPEEEVIAAGEVSPALSNPRDQFLATRGVQLGRAADKLEDLQASHTGLVRQLYTRQVVAQWLAERTITAGRTGAGEYMLVLDEKFPGDLVGWATTNSTQNIRIWGEDNSKMACPSFDLPAGALQVGGSCPGAHQGQSTIRGNVEGGLNIREAPTHGLSGEALEVAEEQNALSREQSRMGYIGSAICQSCYATGGNYLYTNKMLGEMVRYAWCFNATHSPNPKVVDDWVDIMVRSLSTLCYDGNARRKYGISPIRVHSAGDFFSDKYAAAWIKVMNRVGDPNDEFYDPSIRFWAPTRTWATWPKET